MPRDFVALAGVAALDIALHCCSKARPLEVLPDQRMCPCRTVVPRQWGVVVLFENFQDEGNSRRGDEKATLAVEKTVLHDVLTRL